ncbi:class I SAM-dependent methyltransferase [Bacillus alkalicellulosilyticus]|uniref:class I SAM-dependent methyltransferase n=1 Tax=Alkalihalobacterium alkalicellulosilyticum TaxID=1912214 RepID=UPI000998B090|nr:class I SAM-dependent methyltransferase [Bacillus alkalicellulosilyticus]
MNQQSKVNKQAWEYRAYEFWIQRDGSPIDKAKEIMANPKASLKKHAPYFHNIEGKSIANLCGSNGRKAVPLSLLGADVTVFDLSEENKRYAIELAACANTSIDFIVGDIYDIDVKSYGERFDILYLEGGVLHYFEDINRLMKLLYSLLKKDGTMILSDFHPLRRCIRPDFTIEATYFDNELQSGDLAYKHQFSEQEQRDFPSVLIRPFTLSEILNAVITSQFTIQKFDEHRGWNNENIPWEFTVIASK